MQAAPVARIYERFWRPARLLHRQLSFVLRGSARRTPSPARDRPQPNTGRRLRNRCFCAPDGARSRNRCRLRPVLAHAQPRASGSPVSRGPPTWLSFEARFSSFLSSPERFPSINCCGALHLFDQPDAALREMGRVLSPERPCVDPDHDSARPFGWHRVLPGTVHSFRFLQGRRVESSGCAVTVSRSSDRSGTGSAFTLLARKIA